MKRLHSRAKKFFSKRTEMSRMAAALVVVGVFLVAASLTHGAQFHSVEVGFTAVSPNGTSGGQIVPASCNGGDNAADYGQGCTAANSCGQTGSGSYDTCGNCSAVAPATPYSVGAPCTSTANACGQTNSGTITNACSGSCSATTPSNSSCTCGGSPPSNYGQSCQSGANICGDTNTGTIQCNGSCSATTPSNNCGGPATLYCSGNQTTCPVIIGHPVVLTWSCPTPNTSASANFAMNGAASGSATITVSGSTVYTVQCNQTGKQASVTINGINPAVSLAASPSRVNSGSSSTLTWSATQVTSCTLTGPGTSDGASADGNGNISQRNTTTAPITGQSTFTLSCQTSGGPVTTSVTVTLIPNVQEI